MGIDPLTHQPIDKEHETDELLPITETYYDKRNETENNIENANDISLPNNRLSENINGELWNKSFKTISTCYSPSISLESINFSTTSTATESSSNVAAAPAEEDDSVQQWMDSIFSCAINQLEEDLFLLRKYN